MRNGRVCPTCGASRRNSFADQQVRQLAWPGHRPFSESLRDPVTSVREDSRRKVAQTVPQTGFPEDASETPTPVSQVVMAHGQTTSGEGGIRTLDILADIPVFETGLAIPQPAILSELTSGGN